MFFCICADWMRNGPLLEASEVGIEWLDVAIHLMLRSYSGGGQFLEKFNFSYEWPQFCPILDCTMRTALIEVSWILTVGARILGRAAKGLRINRVGLT